MKPRTTILLGIMFVGLVAAYMLTNVRAYRAAREAWEAKRLFDFDPAAVQTLTIQQQGAEAVTAARDASSAWRLAGAHGPIRANAALWDQLAGATAALTNERPVAEPDADLAAFELDTPRLTIEVTENGGAMHRVAFGGLDPTQRHRYARLDDGDVFLARAEFFSALDRPLIDLRDRRIFTNLSEGLTRVDYERLPVEADADAPLDENTKQLTAAIHESYEKDSAGEWRMTVPVEARAWQDRLKLLERALQTAQGQSYVDAPESLGDYGFSTPFSTLTVYGKDGAKETLLFGWPTNDTEAPGIYVKRTDENSVAVADASLLVVLPREPEAFRERRLFTGEAKHVTRLRYRDVSGGFELENDAEKGWHLVGPDADETDQAEVSFFIATLKSILGDSFPLREPEGAFDPARVTIELETSDGRPPVRIEVGGPVLDAESNPVAMYARQDFGGVTTIDFKEFLALQADRFRFRVKTLLAFEKSLASEVELTVDGKRYRFAQANGRWSVVEPADLRLEAQADLIAFLDVVASAEVRGFSGAAPSAEVQGLSAPVLELRIELAGPEPRTLGPIRVGSLTAPQSRDRFVAIAGRDGVYTVDQVLVDTARQRMSVLRSR